MAYARAFLEEKNAKKYPDNQVKLLKEIFRYECKTSGVSLTLTFWPLDGRLQQSESDVKMKGWTFPLLEKKIIYIACAPPAGSLQKPVVRL